MNDATTHNTRPHLIKMCWVAIRPYSLPASTMPVVFGTALAVTVGHAQFKPLLFLLAFVAMVVLQSGANLWNDAHDFERGIDRRVNPVSGAVVRGWITSRQAARAAIACFGVGSAMGLLLAVVVGKPILWLGLAGVAVGVLYSWGPIALKAHALGDLAVLLNFGVLGSLGAWTLQTGAMSWVPAIWALPMSLLVTGILHANNWRDMPFDAEGGVRTVASLIGDRASAIYYGLLVFGAFGGVLILMSSSWLLGIGPRMPLTFLIVFVALPLAIRLMRRAMRRTSSTASEEFLALDGATGQLNLVFGLLSTAALGLDALCQVGWQ